MLADPWEWDVTEISSHGITRCELGKRAIYLHGVIRSPGWRSWQISLLKYFIKFKLSVICIISNMRTSLAYWGPYGVFISAGYCRDCELYLLSFNSRIIFNFAETPSNVWKLKWHQISQSEVWVISKLKRKYNYSIKKCIKRKTIEKLSNYQFYFMKSWQTIWHFCHI